MFYKLVLNVWNNWDYFVSVSCEIWRLFLQCFDAVGWVTGRASLSFNGHFPGHAGLASVYWSKGWWRWWWQLDYWSYKSCKSPVKSSPPTNQHTVFYRLDALPVAQPTVSKHWREKYHIPWACLPQAHLGVFQLCLWPLIAPGYLGGGLPCLSSALWCLPGDRKGIHPVKKNLSAICKGSS